jgi:hypothetical protein
MGVFETTAWAIIAAVAAWGFTLRRAAQHIDRLEAAHRTEVAHWKNETARARAHAAQVTQDKAVWAAGCQQGRDDVISVVPLLIAAQQPDPAPVDPAPVGPAGPGPAAGPAPTTGAGSNTPPGARTTPGLITPPGARTAPGSETCDLAGRS